MHLERVHPLGLDALVTEHPAAHERPVWDLADDPGLTVIRRPQPVDVEGRFRDVLEDVRVLEPSQGGRLEVQEDGFVGPLRQVVGRPGHVEPGVRAIGHDRGPLLRRERIVHRRDDLRRPLGANDPGGEGVEDAHAFASRNDAMYETSDSTPSSGIAL